MNTVTPIAVFTFSLFASGGPGILEILNSNNARWLLYFLSLIVLSAFTADVTFFVYEKFLAVLGYAFVYYTMIKIVSTEKRLATVLGLLVLIHLLLLVLNPDVVLHPESRHYLSDVTFLGDGNDYALSVCIVIPFAIYLYQREESKLKRTMLLLSISILVFAVIGTQSRGGFIALSMLFLYFWVMSEKKIQIFIAAVMLTVVIAMLTPAAFYERMKTITEYEEDGSASGRIMAWTSAVKMAIDHPFTGVGAGHFPVKYGVEYRPPGVGRTDLPWHTAHSIYFLILGELGIPGIIFLLGIIVFNVSRNHKMIKMLKNTQAKDEYKFRILTISINTSIIGFAVGSAFLSTLYYPHIYILAALSECSNRICSNEYA